MSNLKSLRTAILLLACFFSIATYAQKAAVSGTVTDSSNAEALIGVTVMEKGTQNGVSTDFDGNFTINVAPNATLEFSYVGYNAKEVKVSGKTKLNVTLEQTATALDELVVIGYGVQRKSDVTGSITSLGAEDINDVPVSSPLQALQGKASGVNIIQNTGAPGSNTTIKIRGTGTINDSDPLYVVDGFITDEIDHINPNDIENVEIFKDAASSAIYGARAANGVVVITTKSGKEGKTKISFDGYVGFSNPWRKIDVMDAENYALMLDYANNTSLYSSDGRLFHSKDADGNYYFDDDKKFLIDTIHNNGVNKPWLDAVTRTGIKQQYGISVSGGNEKTKYLASVNYYNEKGIVDKSEYTRINARMNLSQQLASWLNLDANISYSNEDTQGIPDGSGSIFRSALLESPMTMLHDQRGYWLTNNPLAIIDRYHSSKNRDRLDMNLSLKADFLKYFNYQFKASFFTNPQTQNSYTEVENLEADWGILDLSTVWKNKTQTNKWEINNLLTFNWLNDAHSITVLAGQTAEGYKYSYQESNKRGTPSNDDNMWHLSSGYTGDKTYGLDREWTAVGFIGRLNYSLLDRYLLQANVRIDGSSMFSKENRWGYFPSVSAGWKFSSEPWMQAAASWMNLGKLRIGWGILGNNRISETSRYTYLNTGYNYPYGLGNHTIQPGTIATVIGNSDIKWERTETFNVGLDFGFLRNSVTFSIEYFNKQTKDILLNVPTVPSAGLNGAPMTNAGAVRNYGMETSLSYKRSFGKFSFDIGFNLSYIKNEVTSLGTGNEPIWGGWIGDSSIAAYVTKTDVGMPIGSFYGYVTDGIFNTMDEVRASAQYEIGKTDAEQVTRPGDFRFKDLNGDNKITDADRTYLGSPLPDIVFGIPLQFSYGDWDLNIFFQGQTGNKIFNMLDYSLCNAANGNVYADIRGRAWSGTEDAQKAFYPTNYNAEIPELSTGDAPRNFRASDFYVQDGSYMRLKELRLSYSIPKKIISKWGLSNVTLSATGYNLWTVTGYHGLDPEVGRVVGSESNLNMGIDFGGFPQARSFLFSFKIGL